MRKGKTKSFALIPFFLFQLLFSPFCFVQIKGDKKINKKKKKAPSTRVHRSWQTNRNEHGRRADWSRLSSAPDHPRRDPTRVSPLGIDVSSPPILPSERFPLISRRSGLRRLWHSSRSAESGNARPSARETWADESIPSEGFVPRQKTRDTRNVPRRRWQHRSTISPSSTRDDPLPRKLNVGGMG